MKREKIFYLVEPPTGEIGRDSAHLYDYVMLLTIVISMIPLFFKQHYPIFQIIDIVSGVLFIVDYLLRWYTADYKLRKGKLSFVLYPFTFMAIIDLLTILPSFSGLVAGFRLLRLVRLMRMMRIFRVFKLMRYSRNVAIVFRVIRKQKSALLAVATLAVGYIVLSALIVFNVEPDTFDDFFHAVYWACVSLTTVGYGDIYPVTTAGQIVTMCSSLMGVAIVALPAGIITAGYMEELEAEKNNHDDL